MVRYVWKYVKYGIDYAWMGAVGSVLGFMSVYLLLLDAEVVLGWIMVSPPVYNDWVCALGGALVVCSTLTGATMFMGFAHENNVGKTGNG